ncbi:heparinase II/III domain-containing protein [Pararoseomonas indoligenes]|uniref:Heparinase II/III-family protein n=1 Tax=Roseomonas indoligenes TaxID=2820811 RepID=A0A940MZL6_9PROT|nr:heparinase II/III family protein [Pararoseomonas indoligenes]MBP0493980.1 heparinase II/III-family protein [Pararoseomonas indoligenes]
MPLQAPQALLRLDAAARLGARPLLWLAWHRGRVASGLAGRALRDLPLPPAPFLPGTTPPAPSLSPGAATAVLAAAGALPPAVAHGPFDPSAPALGMDLFTPGDIRPVWEANRLSWLPALVQAHRLEPEAGHRTRAEARLAEWAAANPPFCGPAWACGQEAALRALHLALSHALLGGSAPVPGMAALLRLHARRIAATRAYAVAQDNNHAVSEPAGLLACAWALGDAAMARHAAGDLARALGRLVAADGGFAQVSTGYHRLLLDVLSLTEWLRRHHGAPPLPAPFPSRAAAAARWLARLVDPATGTTPHLGHQDGSAFADLSLAGPADARGSAERAARLFLGASAGAPDDPGCAWLGLPGAPPLEARAEWKAAGTRGWQRGGARALLRTGPLAFRPGQADLLHLDLWNGPLNLLRDTRTGAYNPPPGQAWWTAHFGSAAAHNLILFDEAEPMPRAGRFLLARWVSTEPLSDGAATRDSRGNRHARRVRPREGRWIVEDRVSGPFRAIALRWHLAPGPWRLEDGVLDGPAARIALSADAPLRLSLEEGWESPAYGAVRPIPVLVARAAAPVGMITTQITFRAGCTEVKTRA